MAEWYSGWSLYGGYNLARAHLSLTRSGNTVNYTVGLQTASGASLLGAVTGTTSQGAINTSVNMGSGAYVRLKSGSYSSPGATSFSASVTPPIGGTLKVSGSLAANGSPPAGAPSTPTFARTGDRSATWSTSGTSGATSLRWQVYDYGGSIGPGWRNLVTTTGTSTDINSVQPNMAIAMRVRGENSFGAGPWSAASERFYTPPNKPTAPTLTVGSGISGSVGGDSYFKYGLEVERSTGTTLPLIGTGVDGSAVSFTDTLPTNLATKYRVRRFVGAAGANTRVYSDWSDWSKTVLDAGYVRPELTGTAQRATGTNPNPAGTSLRVTATGSASTLFAGNKMTVRARSRVKGTTTWSGYTNSPIANANAGDFNTTWNLTGSALIVNTYEVEISVVDSYGSTLTITEVGVGEVALSLSKTGAGVGKVWEPGGATLQVGGDLEVTGKVIEANPNILVVDGVEYPRSGVYAFSGYTLASGAVGFWVTIPADQFPPLPAGYTRLVGLDTTETGFSAVSVPDGRIMLMRTINTPRPVRIVWQLVKIT